MASVSDWHRNILCKVKANLSGNVPNSSQGGLNQYESVIETLTTLFPVWVFLDASRDYFEAWQLFVSCGDVIMTPKTSCGVVITAAESGASFPLKRRDLMLDYILTLMGREESDGYPGSNLELLHTRVGLLLDVIFYLKTYYLFVWLVNFLQERGPISRPMPIILSSSCFQDSPAIWPMPIILSSSCFQASIAYLDYRSLIKDKDVPYQESYPDLALSLINDKAILS
ncbi:hypothetical protein Syun_000708 [Stephania yunnanensis]|uniref:Uncharacterized protein n=1 Tax=Stephania yunnanensis TaxID=152371 RepID=A0AAP0LCG5_9MAGN